MRADPRPHEPRRVRRWWGVAAGSPASQGALSYGVLIGGTLACLLLVGL